MMLWKKQCSPRLRTYRTYSKKSTKSLTTNCKTLKRSWIYRTKTTPQNTNWQTTLKISLKSWGNSRTKQLKVTTLYLLYLKKTPGSCSHLSMDLSTSSFSCTYCPLTKLKSTRKLYCKVAMFKSKTATNRVNQTCINRSSTKPTSKY